jgi:phospholipid transport system substrate-binding protein
MRGQIAWLARSFASASLFLILLSGPAAADQGAEAFAQSLTDQGFAILREGGEEGQKLERFHAFIVSQLDARKAALFTLGHYRRGASEGVLADFVSAFADYSTAVYETHLVDYSAATIRITGSLVNKPGDITVNAVATGANLREPLRIAFRITGASGTYKLVDVQVAGIWLSVEQRDQFASVLSQSNGNIAALTASLKERTNRLRAPRKLAGR